LNKKLELVEMGKRLKELRESKGKNQKDAAADLNIKPSTLSSYEIGDREPPISMLNNLARYYSVTVDCITGNDEMPILNKTGGLIPEEQSVMEDLVSAWNKFIKLEKLHPCDNGEFCDGIHKLQGILALRPLRRQYPEYWKSYKE
jgi:transcriptional regulator with XRE-family HTH domain